MSWCSRPVYHVKVAGPGDSGKTSLLKWFAYGRAVATSPTAGLCVEEVDSEGTRVVFWDSRMPLQDPLSAAAISGDPHLQKKRKDAQIRAIVFVVDASDRGRLKLAARHLDEVLAAFPKIEIVAIFAAKSDRPGSLSLQEVKAGLQTKRIVDRECEVFLSSVCGGASPIPGLSWLVGRLRERDACTLGRFCSQAFGWMMRSCEG
eukprot:Polyplicarium_translucidae@DN3354_c5_g1_i1.p1